jgi:predicted secreted protein
MGTAKRAAIVAVIFVVVVAIGGVIVRSVADSPPPAFGHDDRAIKVEAGQTFTISFRATPSVGDQWSVVANSDPTVVAATGQRQEIDASPPGHTGTPGTVFFDFEALATGTSTIELYNCFQCVNESVATWPSDETLKFDITVVG